MKVNIKGIEYLCEINSVWGPLYTYEEIVGDRMPFDPRKTLCIHLMIYCILYRSNKDFALSLDDFIEALNDMKLEKELRDYYLSRMSMLTVSAPQDEQESTDKKKD